MSSPKHSRSRTENQSVASVSNTHEGHRQNPGPTNHLDPATEALDNEDGGSSGVDGLSSSRSGHVANCSSNESDASTEHLNNLQRSVSCTNASIEHQADDYTQVSPISRYYIGKSSCATAEKFVRKKTAFRMYHRQMSGQAQTELPLYIVYRASTGEFFHFPVMERPDVLHGRLLYVDYGDPDAPEFIGLSALVKYYTTYCVLRLPSTDDSDNGSFVTDVFPWWLQQQGQESE